MGKEEIVMASRLVGILIVVLASGYWIAMPPPCKTSPQQRSVLESMWQVKTKLDVPNLSPPSLSLAIVSKDPIPAFVARIKQVRDIYRKQSPETDPVKIERVRLVEMSVNWEQAILDVLDPYEKLLTINANGESTYGSSEPSGKRWIVTRVAQINGKPVCWYLPVEVKAGEEIKVTLTEENAFDIGALYDKAMQQ